MVAEENSLARPPAKRYLVQAIVFESVEDADQALDLEPTWVEPGNGTLHTAQFQQDNVVATIGTAPTDERIVDLREALEGLVSG